MIASGNTVAASKPARGVVVVGVALAIAWAGVLPAAPAHASQSGPGGLSVAVGTASPRVAARAARKVKLTLIVRDCEGCMFTPERWLIGPKRTSKTYRTKVVSHGRVVFRFTRSATAGLAFGVETPAQESAGNAFVVAALHYAGLPVGDAVTPKRAAQRAKASYCWAGTNRAHYTLRLNTSHWRRPPTTYGQPDNGRRIRVWASPQAKTLRNGRNMQNAHRGVLSSNNVLFCYT